MIWNGIRVCTIKNGTKDLYGLNTHVLNTTYVYGPFMPSIVVKNYMYIKCMAAW